MLFLYFELYSTEACCAKCMTICGNIKASIPKLYLYIQVVNADGRF